MFKKYTVLTLGLLLAGQPAFGARTPFSKVPKKMVVNAARGLGISIATGFAFGGSLGFYCGNEPKYTGFFGLLGVATIGSSLVYASRIVPQIIPFAIGACSGIATGARLGDFTKEVNLSLSKIAEKEQLK